MLKQLNGIAAGLLGLQGYPVKPFSWEAPRQPSTPSDPASIRPATAPGVAKPAARGHTAVGAALHC
jgi:hypothetical protein